MKKEIIGAILIGLFFGLAITYGFYVARQSARSAQKRTTIQNATSSATTNDEDGVFVITSPEDESVQSEPEVIISGTTEPESNLVIFINESELVTTADESGHFTVAAKLRGGGNVITIHSLNEKGQVTTRERTVIYTTAALTQTLGTAPESSSQSAIPKVSPPIKPTNTKTASPTPKTTP